MTKGRPSRLRGFQKGGRGYRDNKERERRRRDNLYYNCGKSGYRAREYNSKPERLYIINEEKADIIIKKADTIMKT